MSILFRTLDGAKWGAGLGRRLTATEVDLNFWQLLERVINIESNPIRPVEIEFIEQLGDQITFHMSDYSVRGPITLPIAQLEFTGNFVPNHQYLRNQIVQARDSLWQVLHNFTSGPTFVLGSDVLGNWYRLIMPLPTKFSVGFFFPGKPGAGVDISDYEAQAMWTYCADRQFWLPAGLSGSVGKLLIAADAPITLPILQGGTEVGSILIGTSEIDCTFTFPADVQWDVGDTLRILRPDSLDTLAKDLAVTLQGTLGELAS